MGFKFKRKVWILQSNYSNVNKFTLQGNEDGEKTFSFSSGILCWKITTIIMK